MHFFESWGFFPSTLLTVLRRFRVSRFGVDIIGTDESELGDVEESAELERDFFSII